jgi:hypothetical protein
MVGTPQPGNRPLGAKPTKTTTGAAVRPSLATLSLTHIPTGPLRAPTPAKDGSHSPRWGQRARADPTRATSSNFHSTHSCLIGLRAVLEPATSVEAQVTSPGTVEPLRQTATAPLVAPRSNSSPVTSTRPGMVEAALPRRVIATQVTNRKLPTRGLEAIPTATGLATKLEGHPGSSRPGQYSRVRQCELFHPAAPDSLRV